MSIYLHNEDRQHFLQDSDVTINWLKSIILSSQDYFLEELNYVFCSDDYLLKINLDFLNHDYYTDVITFDHSNQENTIAGDIYISIDRVIENSDHNNIIPQDELHRIMVHGLLHLLGFNDKTKAEKQNMTLKEDAFLLLLKK